MFKKPAIPELKFKRLSPHAILPTRATKGSAAFDLYAPMDHHIHVSHWKLIPTGWAVEIPEGFCGLICPRSGLANKAGMTVLNAPGLIDSDFRAEMGILLINHNQMPQKVSHGDRIGQLLILPAPIFNAVEAETLTDPGTRQGGFGSTGR